MGSSLVKPGKKRKKPPKGLTTTERKFALEYLANGMRGADAARATYPNVSSANAARVRACKLLKNPRVKALIESELSKMEDDLRLRRAQWLAKLFRVNDFNVMTSFVDTKDGQLVVDKDKFDEVADEIGDAVTKCSIKVKEREDGTDTEITVEIMDKKTMFMLEGKYLGTVDSDGNVNVNIHDQGVEQLLPMLMEQIEKDSGNGVVDGKVIESKVK